MHEKERIEKFLESINEDNIGGFFNTLIEICNVEEMIKDETYNKYKIDAMMEDGVDKITDELDCKVALDLINHLCNGDKGVINNLLDEIASALILNEDFKERNGRILRLYGSEETGKSVFIRFLKKVFNTSNCSSIELNKLGTDNYYEAGRVADSIFVMDEYGSDIPYKESVLRILRLVILGQRIKVRQPYKPFEEVSPICKIIVTSYYPFSDDIMEFLGRRAYQIEIKNKLERTDEWFNQLFSEKECQAFFNLCIKRTEKIMDDFNKGIDIIK